MGLGQDAGLFRVGLGGIDGEREPGEGVGWDGFISGYLSQLVHLKVRRRAPVTLPTAGAFVDVANARAVCFPVTAPHEQGLDSAPSNAANMQQVEELSELTACWSRPGVRPCAVCTRATDLVQM